MTSQAKAFIHPKTDSIVSARGRILWFAATAPRRGKGGKEGKYEFNLLFPAASDHKVVQERALEAGKDKHSKAFKDAAGKWPKAINSPFKRTEDNDKLVAALEAEGIKVADYPMYYCARSKDKPGVVGPNGKSDGIEDDDIFSGRWARMTHDAYGYDVDGNKGVAFGLKNIQLLDIDDPLVIGGGRVAAESEFEASEGAGDDSKSSDDMFS